MVTEDQGDAIEILRAIHSLMACRSDLLAKFFTFVRMLTHGGSVWAQRGAAMREHADRLEIFSNKIYLRT